MDKRAIDRLTRRGVTEIIVETELREMLESGKVLRLKEGFDPSRPDIHLGHVVGLRKLRQFQEYGHQVVLIVGDWTAQIGDPSGQSQTRTMLTAEEVKANAATYMKQFFKVIDREKTEIRWQSEWYGKFNLADVIKLTSKFTVAQVMAREDFATRQAAGRPVAVTELLYPLLQAYDSVVIKADVEFGGIDQKFNCLMGRQLQQMMGLRPQQVLLMPLLVGTDGKMKMSKSLGNYIAVEDPPDEMYGKIMSIPDNLIMSYFELVTGVPDKELAEFSDQLATNAVNPMILKKRLAKEIITQFHTLEKAEEAEARFQREVQSREIPQDITEISIDKLLQLPETEVSIDKLRKIHFEAEGRWTYGQEVGRPETREYRISIPIVLSRSGLVKSNAEAKRLISQDGIQVIRPDGSKHTVAEEKELFRVGDVIKVGKRRFLKIVDTNK